MAAEFRQLTRQFRKRFFEYEITTILPLSDDTLWNIIKILLRFQCRKCVVEYPIIDALYILHSW